MKTVVELCRLAEAIRRELPPDVVPREDNGFEVLARGVFPRLGVPALLDGRDRPVSCF